MNDGFYAVTKWLPTYIQMEEDKHFKIDLDGDLSGWIEHLKKLGLKEGRDFQVRSREDGKKAIFRRGASPFQNKEKYYPHSVRNDMR